MEPSCERLESLKPKEVPTEYVEPKIEGNQDLSNVECETSPEKKSVTVIVHKHQTQISIRNTVLKMHLHLSKKDTDEIHVRTEGFNITKGHFSMYTPAKYAVRELLLEGLLGCIFSFKGQEKNAYMLYSMAFRAVEFAGDPSEPRFLIKGMKDEEVKAFKEALRESTEKYKEIIKVLKTKE